MHTTALVVNVEGDITPQPENGFIRPDCHIQIAQKSFSVQHFQQLLFHSSAWTEENFDRCTRPEVESPLFHRKYEFLTNGGNNGEGKVEGLPVGPWDNFLISTFQGGVPHQIVQPAGKQFAQTVR